MSLNLKIFGVLKISFYSGRPDKGCSRNYPQWDGVGGNILSPFFSPYGSPIILVVTSIKHFHKIPTGSSPAGVLNTGGV